MRNVYIECSRIVFYLLQFYLFAISGALAYLSTRAWIDPHVAGRLVGQSRPKARLAHLARAGAFSALAVSWLVSALYLGKVGVQIDAIFIVQLIGAVAVLLLIPKSLRASKIYIVAVGVIVLGEAIRIISPSFGSKFGLALPFISSLCLATGYTLIGYHMKGALLRLRVLDRLVIAFAVSSIFITQLIVALFLVFVFSIGSGKSAEKFIEIVKLADKPVVFTLSAIIVISAFVGYFLARDISSPLNDIEDGLRSIGEGDLDYRVQLRSSADDDVQDLAKEVNRMAQRLKSVESVRAEFFSFVSHELKNPITSIRGFIQTLQADPSFTDDDRAEIYDIVAEESDRLLRMINEYLNIARVQAGRPVSLAPSRFDSGRHLEKVCEIMRAHTKIHEIVVSRPAKAVSVEADPDKFDQVLINLISNAIKYSPKGGRILVSLRDLDDRIEISVQDEGIGMTREQSEKIFNKYYRVSDDSTSSTLAKIEGTGIGLYLTRAIVESHGGSIAIQSDVGKGSTFTVWFPKVAKAAEVVVSPPAPPVDSD